MAPISTITMRSFGWVLPLLALAASASAQPKAPTLVSLEVSPDPDESGVYSFVAEPGDVISINVATSPDDPAPSCYPEFVSDLRVDLILGDYIMQTPYSDSVVVRIDDQNAGLYRYRVVQTTPIRNLLGETEPMGSPDNLVDERWCQVTVQQATPTEQQWAIANRLYDQQEDLEQALDLYRQVIATKPGYPEPYERYLSLLIKLNIGDRYFSSDEDPEVAGQELARWFTALPTTTQQPILETLEQLAQLYEANPTWQLDPYDHPDFWRGYANYLQTGLPPAL
ncbi:hypothetical protein H6F75_15340 [Nodosilinea sp. FACHB-131]|uniref:hypothetical protein n=1 Tax=Cyanophyceae TaxID=3028117 RepID=UPI001682CFA2|nr:hypothetical protein [Nodosilinea sp. FACHB-131]MBD1874860.1 hypothetical protein [Nodosilinea sp. FACHB-131]